METRGGRIGTSVDVCNAPYTARDFLPVALRSWKGTHGAPVEFDSAIKRHVLICRPGYLQSRWMINPSPLL